MQIHRLAAELPAADGLQAVVVTSANAVAALPSCYRSVPLLAVGEATAHRAREAEHNNVLSADGDAAALVALAARHCSPCGAPLLLAVGRRQGAALEASLKRCGFQVERREVYAAEPVPVLPAAARRALCDEELRAALFFSAETARTFVDLVCQDGLAGRLHDIEALALAREVADALAPLRWRGVRAALRPNQEELLALLQ